MKRNWIIVLIIAVIMITAIICVFLQTTDDNSKSNIADFENEIICTDSMKISSLIDKVLNLPDFRPYVDHQINSHDGLVIENNSNSGIDMSDAIQNFKKHNPPTDKSLVFDYFEKEYINTSIGFGKIDIRNDSAWVWAGFGGTPSGRLQTDHIVRGVIATFVLKDCEWELIELEVPFY